MLGPPCRLAPQTLSRMVPTLGAVQQSGERPFHLTMKSGNSRRVVNAESENNDIKALLVHRPDLTNPRLGATTPLDSRGDIVLVGVSVALDARRLHLHCGKFCSSGHRSRLTFGGTRVLKTCRVIRRARR